MQSQHAERDPEVVSICAAAPVDLSDAKLLGRFIRQQNDCPLNWGTAAGFHP